MFVQTDSTRLGDGQKRKHTDFDHMSIPVAASFPYMMYTILIWCWAFLLLWFYSCVTHDSWGYQTMSDDMVVSQFPKNSASQLADSLAEVGSSWSRTQRRRLLVASPESRSAPAQSRKRKLWLFLPQWRERLSNWSSTRRTFVVGSCRVTPSNLGSSHGAVSSFGLWPLASYFVWIACLRQGLVSDQ